jgi:hypothetical protein
MAYRHQLTTFIFNKLSCDVFAESICLATPKRRHREAGMRTDLRRFGFRGHVTEAGPPAVTCVSTLSLCNANFAQS